MRQVKLLHVYCLQTSRCDKVFVWCINSQFGRVGMRTSSYESALIGLLIFCRSDLSQTCTHKLRQRCYRSFCCCIVSHKFSQFEFVQRVATTKFCHSDIVCRMSQLPSVSRPYNYFCKSIDLMQI